MAPRHKINWPVLASQTVAALSALVAAFSAGGAGVPLLSLLPPHDRTVLMACVAVLAAFLPRASKASGLTRAVEERTGTVPPSPPNAPLTTPVPAPPQGDTPQ